ncbi:CPBP family intramembrane metalloprotease [bacterium]|nr:MAG: CPBP family intramembrane metalloprotease [bacterium]
MFLFYNEHNKLRAGWKIGIFLIFLILPTFLVSIAFDFVPKEYRSLPVILAFILPLASWLTLRYVDHLPMKAIGMFTGDGFLTMLKDIGLGLFSGAFAMGAIAFILNGMDGFSFQINPNIDYSKALGFLITMIGVGVYEELQVRGYILRMLTDGFRFGNMSVKQSFLASALFTSFIFGFLHIWNPNANWASTLNISLAGLLLVLPIAITGRMYASFALHFSWNWFQAGLFGMPVSGSTIEHSIFTYNLNPSEVLLSGGKFGPEAGLLGIIGMLLAALPFYFLYQSQSRTLRIFDTQFFAFDEPEVNQVEQNTYE